VLNPALGDVAAAPQGQVSPHREGRIHGFVVPRGEIWRVKGLVRSDKNVIVRGTLVMRPGDTLRFVNVREAGVTLHRSDKVETLRIDNPEWNALITSP
jgi:hypothetical protein